jgi:hypothetical protein
VLGSNVEIVSLLSRAQDELDPSRRLGPPMLDVTCDAVDGFVAELDEWWLKWRDAAGQSPLFVYLGRPTKVLN